MAEPLRKFSELPFGKAWNEARNPTVVGQTGMTACENLTYRRFGAWGKRAGTSQVYRSVPGPDQAPFPTAPCSATRWYRAYPEALTQTIIVAAGTIWKGLDPNALAPSALTDILDMTTPGKAPAFFASVRDPAINGGNGGDILVIAGAGTSANGFGTGTLTISGTPAAGQTITATLVNGGTSITTAPYTVLPTDNIESIAAALAKAINLSAAVTPGIPFIGQAVVTGDAVITVYALNSGGISGAPTAQSSAVSGMQSVTWFGSEGTGHIPLPRYGQTNGIAQSIPANTAIGPEVAHPIVLTLPTVTTPSDGDGSSSLTISLIAPDGTVIPGTSADLTIVGSGTRTAAGITLVTAATTITYQPAVQGDAGQWTWVVQAIAANGNVAADVPYYSGYTVSYAGTISYFYATGTITIKGTVTGAGMAVAPTGATALVGGGILTAAPLKWDGTTLSGLSGQIQRDFTGCVFWHDHLWFWGSSDAPDTVFAADINQPESFTFMLQNGGYEIRVGDGDPQVQNCVPVGNSLYVFKRNSIHVISGYDFQAGEYQFQITPQVVGSGIPSPLCVSVLNNALVYWNGSRFERLAIGSFDPEYIGAPIPITSAKIAANNQALIRSVAGNFIQQTYLNDVYQTPGPPLTQELYNSVAMWAVDVGNSVADTVLVYDDDTTQFIQEHAWSPFTGFTVGCFFTMGNNLNAAQTASDEPSLLFMPAPGGIPLVSQYGANPGNDSGTPIAFMAQTGWVTCGSPALIKKLHRLFLHLEASPGVQITVTIITSSAPNYPPKVVTFPAIGGDPDTESYQLILSAVNPSLKANAYIFRITESSGSDTFEIAGATLDYIEEPFTP